MTTLPFELVAEAFGKPVAALIPQELSLVQFYSVNGLLPESAVNHPDLASRWNLFQVIGTRDWANAQRKRIPMLKPRATLKLAFLQ